MPSSPGDPRRALAEMLMRGWNKYQGALPEWATQEYGLPDIGGGFTDTFPSTGGAMLEGGYNTLRDLTTVNPSVDLPIALAALATGGGALAARGISRHGDEAAEGISGALRRGYQSDAPLAGSQGIPHTSGLPNQGAPPRGGGSLEGFGTSPNERIRGDVAFERPPNDFQGQPELRQPLSPDPRGAPTHGQIQDPYGSGLMADPNQHGQLPFEHPANAALHGPPDVLDDIRAGRYSPAPERFSYDDASVRRVEDNWYPDDTMAMVEGPGINPNLTPEIERQITDTFEQLLMRGSSPEEAMEIVSLQFGDLL